MKFADPLSSECPPMRQCFLLYICLALTNALELPGFQTSPYWEEQIYWGTIDPDVILSINAPNDSSLDPTMPSFVVLYLLPNGNTINETIGRTDGPGVNWHYLIQQIGAQTRRLRSSSFSHVNLFVVYLQATSLSWPTWSHSNGALAPKVVSQALSPLSSSPLGPPQRVVLASHSGGGAFIFALMSAAPSLPGIHRLVFLDSDYNYDESPEYGPDFLKWLSTGKTPDQKFPIARETQEQNFVKCLVVVAYDDRNITLNGKPVTCPTCGTYRHTHHLISFLQKQPEVNLVHYDPDISKTGTNNPIDTWLAKSKPGFPNLCIDIRIHQNPLNKILHTVLVYTNGLIHGFRADGTRYEYRNDGDYFFGPIEFGPWIQGGY